MANHDLAIAVHHPGSELAEFECKWSWMGLSQVPIRDRLSSDWVILVQQVVNFNNSIMINPQQADNRLLP